jgi:hypothetical protein
MRAGKRRRKAFGSGNRAAADDLTGRLVATEKQIERERDALRRRLLSVMALTTLAGALCGWELQSDCWPTRSSADPLAGTLVPGVT